MSSQETGGSWTAKDIALYVGAPVAAVCVVGGVAYYLYSRSDEHDQNDPEKSPAKDLDAVDGAKSSEQRSEKEEKVCS